MPNLNRVLIIGTLTRDPELKYLPNGTACAQIGMAINRAYTQDGEKREETTFVDVELWGRTAELAGEYLKKGKPVFIEGRLKLDTWDDKQTDQKRSKMKVVAETMQFIGGRDQAAPTPTPSGGQRTMPKPKASDPDLDPEDSVPF